MKLDLTSFEKAVEQLQTSLDYYNSGLAKKDHGIAAQFRSACIQGFEYSYESSWKMLKRYLEMTEPSAEEIDQMSFPNLIRIIGLKYYKWVVRYIRMNSPVFIRILQKVHILRPAKPAGQPGRHMSQGVH